MKDMRLIYLFMAMVVIYGIGMTFFMDTWIYIWNYGHVFGNDGFYFWTYLFKKN